MFNIFGNSNTNGTVHWQPEPTTRGTFGVLSTCLITISLCIWTSLHLNVPGANEKSSLQLWRKGNWLVIGLLAPEFVLFTAWHQYIQAKETAEMVSKILSKHSRRGLSHTEMPTRNVTVETNLEDPEQGSPEPKDIDLIKFTIKQGFFINMGGLAFDATAAKGVYIPSDGPDYWFLEEYGIGKLCYLHPEVFDTVVERSINDKSKTGNFGKTLVCLQAMWFIAQCISRLAQGLAISLLELNTLGHRVCALLVYCFWWSKPLDVEQPILIEGDKYRETLAWFWMCSVPREKQEIPERHLVDITRQDEPLHSTEPTVDVSTFQMTEMPHQGSPESTAVAQTILKPGQVLPRTCLRYALVHPNDLTLSAIDVLRWQLASPRFETLGDTRFIRRCKNASEPTGLSFRNKWLAWSTLLFTSAIYGGLHALAWNLRFGSHVEQILWRVSASSVMSYGFAAFACFKIYGYGEETGLLYVMIDLLAWNLPGVRKQFADAQVLISWSLGVQDHLSSKNRIVRGCSRRSKKTDKALHY